MIYFYKYIFVKRFPLKQALVVKTYTTKINKSYTNFGHAKLKEPHGFVLYLVVLISLMSSAIFMSPVAWLKTLAVSVGEKFDKIVKLPSKLKPEKVVPKVDALDLFQENPNKDTDAKPLDNNIQNEQDKKVINYENRLRKFSSLNKIFKYFSTIQIRYEDGQSEILMTLEDFLRVITPGATQPKELGFEQYKTLDTQTLARKAPKYSHYKTGGILEKIHRLGFITFADFIFLLMLISTPEKLIETVFLMYDKDGNGYIDCHEYNQVQRILRNLTSPSTEYGNGTQYSVTTTNIKGEVGKRYHRNLTIKSLHNSGLAKFLFGSDYNDKIGLDSFFTFIKAIKEELLVVKFNLYAGKSSGGVMTERDFTKCLIKYSLLNKKKRKLLLKRVKTKYQDVDNQQGILVEDFVKFSNFLNSIDDINLAFEYSTILGHPIDRETFKHIVSVISASDVSPHLLDVCFTIFDTNEDGILDRQEFFDIVQSRLNRGMVKKERLGVFKIMTVLGRCTLPTSS